MMTYIEMVTCARSPHQAFDTRTTTRRRWYCMMLVNAMKYGAVTMEGHIARRIVDKCAGLGILLMTLDQLRAAKLQKAVNERPVIISHDGCTRHICKRYYIVGVQTTPVQE